MLLALSRRQSEKNTSYLRTKIKQTEKKKKRRREKKEERKGGEQQAHTQDG